MGRGQRIGEHLGSADRRGTREELRREVTAEGVEVYRRVYDDRPHRDDGPAAVVPAGVVFEGLFPFHGPVRGPAQLWMQMGVLDRRDGPALVSADGVEESFQRGFRHAEGRPAVVIPDGVIWRPRDRPAVPGPAELWYLNGVLDRADGPAVRLGKEIEIHFRRGVRHRDGDLPAYVSSKEISWWDSGSLSRLRGPAMIRADGRREWYRAGLLHRAEGPAIEGPDGDGEWFWLGGASLERKEAIGPMAAPDGEH